MTVSRAKHRPLSISREPKNIPTSSATGSSAPMAEERKASDPMMPGSPTRRPFDGKTTNYQAPPSWRRKSFLQHLTGGRVGIPPPNLIAGNVMVLGEVKEGLAILAAPKDKKLLATALEQLENQHSDKTRKTPEGQRQATLKQRLAMLQQLKNDAPVYAWVGDTDKTRVPLDPQQRTTLRCAIAAALISDIPDLKKRKLQMTALKAATELWHDHEEGRLSLGTKGLNLLSASLKGISQGQPSRMKNEAADLGRLAAGEEALSPGKATHQTREMLARIDLFDETHELLTDLLDGLSGDHAHSTTVMQNHLAVIHDLEVNTASPDSLMSPNLMGQARCAVVAAAMKAIPTRSGEVEQQQEAINAVATLWNDYKDGKVKLDVSAKLLVVEQLAELFKAKTPFSAQAIELRGLFLDSQTHAYARLRMEPIAPFPDPSQILDLGSIEPEERSEASQQQTRPAVMAEVDEIDYRDKDIKYGNSRAATEVLDGALTTMTGMDAPDAKLAVNGAHLFHPSKESRADYADHADHPERFAFVASPLTLEYQDVGDLAHDSSVMRETIEKDSGKGGVKKYDLAVARYAKAEGAETKMLAAQEKAGHAEVQKGLDRERQALAVEKANTLETLERLTTGNTEGESTDDAEDMGLLGLKEVRGSRASFGGIVQRMDPLRAVEAKLRSIHEREADLNEREDKHWEPNRKARMEKYNAMMDMVELFPRHMKEEIQKLHMTSLLNHNFDPYNWGLANAGFSTIGEMVRWRISVVDHGNSVMDGFGGMQKVNSWLRGNTRARKDDPLMPNFVMHPEVQPRYVPASISGISSFQRAMPFVRLLEDMIKAETRVAEDIPIDKFMMKYEEELGPAFEMAYRFSLMPKDSYERVTKNKWPGGEDGHGSEQFPWRPGDVHRSSQEVADILFDRNRAIVEHFPPELLDAWKAKYPEKAARAYQEVAAGIAGTTGYYIEHPDSRPTSVRSVPV